MEDVIIARTSLDEFGFESLLGQLFNIDLAHAQKLEIDLSGVEFIDPYGMVGLLEVGRHNLNFTNRKPILHLPILDSVVKYMERMNFFELAGEFYIIRADRLSKGGSYMRKGYSDVLLELTRIENSLDIHSIVTEVKKRAKSILQTHLHYDEGAIAGFIVALSEVCQNIPEHSEDIGLVGIQKYFYEKKLNKNVVKIAVMDLGIGIKKSLGPKFSALYGRKWSDLMAIEKALFEGASRYEDLGRGHGLIKVREFVERWNGRISIRSRTAKVTTIPKWDRGSSLRVALSSFPGTQINITLPQISF